MSGKERSIRQIYSQLWQKDREDPHAFVDNRDVTPMRSSLQCPTPCRLLAPATSVQVYQIRQSASFLRRSGGSSCPPSQLDPYSATLKSLDCNICNPNPSLTYRGYAVSGAVLQKRPCGCGLLAPHRALLWCVGLSAIIVPEAAHIGKGVVQEFGKTPDSSRAP